VRPWADRESLGRHRPLRRDCSRRTRARLKLRLAPTVFVRYDLSLGWYRAASQHTTDPPSAEHLGGGAGSYKLIRIYPARGVSIAIMGNATKHPIDAAARLALTG
jgi:hypothetical protein